MTGGTASTEHDFRVKRDPAPLRHGVTESIRNAVALGRFKAGQRLPERDLCEMTGVSRTLVREALRQLESEGLIEVVPHRGPIVTRVTPAQAEGIYQVRMELEGLACRLFAEKAGDLQRDALKAALADLEQAHTVSDPLAWLNAKNRFYECLIDGSGNEALGFTLRMLNSRVMLLRATSMKAPGRAAASLAELHALVDALMSGDGQAAWEAGTRHVRNAAAAAIAQLPADEAGAKAEA